MREIETPSAHIQNWGTQTQNSPEQKVVAILERSS